MKTIILTIMCMFLSCCGWRFMGSDEKYYRENSFCYKKTRIYFFGIPGTDDKVVNCKEIEKLKK